MNNYLIITLGTRDVQIKKENLAENCFIEIDEGREQFIEKSDIKLKVFQNSNFPEYYTFSPREGGEIVWANYDLFKPVIDFPLIKDFVEQANRDHQIDYMLLIYTDQQVDWDAGRISRKKNYLDDTLYFKDIIQRYFEEHDDFLTVQFEDYTIRTEVVNIDYQYTHFKEVKSNLFLIEYEDVNQIFLLPQGGIDQINHAVTLQLLQAFKTKVKLFQKSEGENPRQLQFTNYFLNDLNRQKIQKHLDDYDFGMIDKTLNSNREIFYLSQYAFRRLELKNNQNKSFFDLIRSSDIKEKIDLDFSDNSKKLDLYISAKIALKHNKINDFLWKIFTLNENIFSLKIGEKLGDVSKYYNPKYNNQNENPLWVDKLNRYRPRLVSKLRSQNILLNNPNRRACFSIFMELFPDDPKLEIYVRINGHLEELSKARHKLAHSLGATDSNQINQILGPDYSINNLISDLDQIFDLKSPYGIYDDIKAEIERLL